ncbi:MAG: cell division protein FtsL [Gammaproteobacteria bacterium]|nr:cell division protein FtsL [Gammaproteobacteria bacterium]MBL6999446.1 cell division protein FtsL [Gammaproteobacteria bacterium]
MQRIYWVLLLTVVVIGSSMAVIYVKHESRILFSELRLNQKQQDEKLLYWSRLQIQQSTLMTQANVESVASKRLNMVLPDNIQIVTLIDYE